MTEKKEITSSANDILANKQEVLQMFKRGAEFTEELLKENERLRFVVADLENKLGRGPAMADDNLVKELLDKTGRLEAEREELVKRFSEVEAENKDFASRYVQVEAENNSLMAIYVASYQLHSTLDFQEVLQIITEIILNFVGAEVFCITLLDEGTGDMHPLVCEGIDANVVSGQSSKSELVVSMLKSGKAHFAPDIANLTVDPQTPAVIIPLQIKDRVIGAVLVYKFLPQKTHLAHVDHELFTLLAGHAATAIFSAKLYTDSRRKLDTIQGLIDLVTQG